MGTSNHPITDGPVWLLSGRFGCCKTLVEQAILFCSSANMHVYNQQGDFYWPEMTLRSEAYRAYALLCEQRAPDEADPVAKREWELTANDWNRMAKAVADSGDDVESPG